MKTIHTATHLLRQFMLFALTVLLLLSVMRLAYGFWQFPKIVEADALLSLFLHGLRFDIALIGLLCVVPVFLGSLLSVFDVTRAAAKFVIIAFLLGGVFLVLTLELFTPWFISTQGVRPDQAVFAAIESPLSGIKHVFAEHTVPIVIGLIVSFLILIAFWNRLEVSRFLRRRVYAPTGVLLAVVGLVLCALLIRSTLDFTKSTLSPADAAISSDSVVNELAMNTTFKMFHSVVSPLLASP